MPDILDALEWKPWPKDPKWAYAEISGVARIGRTAGEAGDSLRYFIRTLDDDGKLGDCRYTNIERDEAARIVADTVKALNLEAAS
jgi:hypothetical protein